MPKSIKDLTRQIRDPATAQSEQEQLQIVSENAGLRAEIAALEAAERDPFTDSLAEMDRQADAAGGWANYLKAS